MTTSGRMVPTLTESKKELRIFGIGIGVILGLAASLLFWKGKNTHLVLPLAGLSVSTIVAGCILPHLLMYPFRIWSLFIEGVGWLNTRLILLAAFFFLFVPLGLILRIFGWDPLKLRTGRDKSSFWVTRKPDSGGIEKYSRQY